jgi:hypothetical protein
MFKIKKLFTQKEKNPFKELCGKISTEWEVVSLDFLEQVCDIINKAKPIINTYGDAFEVLEYLHTAKVLELKLLAKDTGIYKIRKIEYSGENKQ